MTTPPPRVVDTHSHVIPPQLVAAMEEGRAPDGITLDRNGGTPWVVHRQGYRYPLLPGFHDVAARLDAMDRDQVTVSVLSVAPPLFLYWVDAAEAVASSRLVNDAIAAMVVEHPDRFAGLATLPMQDPDAAAVELRRAVTELGLRGAQIGPHVEGVPLDDPSFRPVLRAAAELDVPLVLHPYYVGAATGELADFYLTNLQGNPWQTAVSASRLILSGTLDELPGLSLVLVHGGGHLPYQIGRLDHGHRVRPEAARPQHPPSTYLRRFHYDSLTHDLDATRWLIEKVGADRVMFGTDYPFDMAGGTYAEQLAAVASGSPVVPTVGSVTADALFRLQPAPAEGELSA
ncbi:amidohydrolase family protein [Microlunatus antarcticus]|uniref:Aminocarboxymuconate-semialdehyde decarboxylase n=1 Tax=Microlunatus antarcticus TaxID=53388 RepID=A0A7W5JWD8_9ACTN|nr:aminocarboxymuconate-semialdehyde decarboxylase [Microlunatus antarcticus]